ncbi:hypothetical protein GX48_03788 [Paracoccidioides brasiliensis]|nr:hypothetical protein GX48_03788 [Paracoccidioides brasiliensis]
MERLPSDTNPSTDLESGPGTSFANNRESSLSSGHGDDNDDLRIEQISSKDSGVDPASVLFQSYYPEALNRPHSDISWVGSVQNFLLFVIGTLSGRATDAGYFKASRGPFFDWAAFKEIQFSLFAVAMFLNFWDLYVAFFYIRSYGRNVIGLSKEKSMTSY